MIFGANWANGARDDNGPDLGTHSFHWKNEAFLKNWYRHPSFRGVTRRRVPTTIILFEFKEYNNNNNNHSPSRDFPFHERSGVSTAMSHTRIRECLDHISYVHYPFPETQPNSVRTLHFMEGPRREEPLLTCQSIIGIVRVQSLGYIHFNCGLHLCDCGCGCGRGCGCGCSCGCGWLGRILGRIWGGFWDGKVHYGKWSQEVNFLSKMWICGPPPMGSWLAEV